MNITVILLIIFGVGMLLFGFGLCQMIICREGSTLTLKVVKDRKVRIGYYVGLGIMLITSILMLII